MIQTKRPSARGPTTEFGRRRSAQNSLKHGLYAVHTVILGEDPEAFGLLIERLAADLSAHGETELQIVQALASSIWRRKRYERVERDLFNAAIAAWGSSAHYDRGNPPPASEVLDAVLCGEFGNRFARIQQAHNAAMRQFGGALASLARVRKSGLNDDGADVVWPAEETEIDNTLAHADGEDVKPASPGALHALAGDSLATVAAVPLLISGDPRLPKGAGAGMPSWSSGPQQSFEEYIEEIGWGRGTNPADRATTRPEGPGSAPPAGR